MSAGLVFLGVLAHVSISVAKGRLACQGYTETAAATYAKEGLVRTSPTNTKRQVEEEKQL